MCRKYDSKTLKRHWLFLCIVLLFIFFIFPIESFAADSPDEITSEELTISNGSSSFSIGQIYCPGSPQEQWPLEFMMVSGPEDYESRIYLKYGLRIITSNINHNVKNRYSDMKDRIAFLEVTKDSYWTSRGIHVGGSIEEVLDKYKDFSVEEGTVMMSKNENDPYDQKAYQALIYQSQELCPFASEFNDFGNYHKRKLAFVYNDNGTVTRILMVDLDPDSYGYMKNAGYQFEKTITMDDMGITNGEYTYQIGGRFLEQTKPYTFEEQFSLSVDGEFWDYSYRLNDLDTLETSNYNHNNNGDTDGEYYISTMSLQTTEYKTLSGVGVGDSIEKVKAAYSGITVKDSEAYIPNSEDPFIDGVTPYPIILYSVMIPCLIKDKANFRDINILFAYDQTKTVTSFYMEDSHVEKSGEISVDYYITPRDW